MKKLKRVCHKIPFGSELDDDVLDVLIGEWSGLSLAFRTETPFRLEHMVFEDFDETAVLESVIVGHELQLVQPAPLACFTSKCKIDILEQLIKEGHHVYFLGQPLAFPTLLPGINLTIKTSKSYGKLLLVGLSFS